MSPRVLPSPRSLLPSTEERGSPRDRELVMRTYELARSAVEHGNYPFGALLVHDGEIIHEAENAVITSGDVTQHAELRLISEATRKFDRRTIEESTLYTSTEPCPMCAGAIRFSGARRVVYGTSVAGMRGFSLRPPTVSVHELYARIAPDVEILGPVAEEEGIALHRDAWEKIRRREGVAE